MIIEFTGGTVVTLFLRQTAAHAATLSLAASSRHPVYLCPPLPGSSRREEVGSAHEPKVPLHGSKEHRARECEK